MLAVISWAQSRWGGLPLALGGFSFGAYVQTRVAARLAEGVTPAGRIVLVGTAAGEVSGARSYPPCRCPTTAW
jgi:alpha/beta superfamily hydrolase